MLFRGFESNFEKALIIVYSYYIEPIISEMLQWNDPDYDAFNLR